MGGCVASARLAEKKIAPAGHYWHHRANAQRNAPTVYNYGGGAVAREGAHTHIRIYTVTRLGVYGDAVCPQVVPTVAFGAQKNIYTVGVEANESVYKHVRVYRDIGVYGCVSSGL